MTVNTQQFKSTGIRPPKSLVNAYSVAGWSPVSISTAISQVGIKSSLSGAMTANTLKTFISVSGAGMMSALAIRTEDATARTMRIKITVDGVVAFDYTSASITSVQGAAILGPYNTTSPFPADFIVWNSSLLVEAASSLTETDKFGIYTKYQTF